MAADMIDAHDQESTSPSTVYLGLHEQLLLIDSDSQRLTVAQTCATRDQYVSTISEQSSLHSFILDGTAHLTSLLLVGTCHPTFVRMFSYWTEIYIPLKIISR